jgi:hypothetical protein
MGQSWKSWTEQMPPGMLQRTDVARPVQHVSNGPVCDMLDTSTWHACLSKRLIKCLFRSRRPNGFDGK